MNGNKFIVYVISLGFRMIYQIYWKKFVGVIYHIVSKKVLYVFYYIITLTNLHNIFSSFHPRA